MHDRDSLTPVTLDTFTAPRTRRFHALALAAHAGIFWLLFSAALCSVSRAPTGELRTPATAHLAAHASPVAALV